MFGGTLADQPIAQGLLAEMSARLDASRLLTYRTAWLQQFNSYRLGTALGRWDEEYRFWLHAQTNFELLRQTFKSGDALPTLRQLTSEPF